MYTWMHAMAHMKVRRYLVGSILSCHLLGSGYGTQILRLGDSHLAGSEMPFLFVYFYCACLFVTGSLCIALAVLELTL